MDRDGRFDVIVYTSDSPRRCDGRMIMAVVLCLSVLVGLGIASYIWISGAGSTAIPVPPAPYAWSAVSTGAVVGPSAPVPPSAPSLDTVSPSPPSAPSLDSVSASPPSAPSLDSVSASPPSAPSLDSVSASPPSAPSLGTVVSWPSSNTPSLLPLIPAVFRSPPSLVLGMSTAEEDVPSSGDEQCPTQLRLWSQPPRLLRLMTYNIEEGGKKGWRKIADVIRREQPHILALQELNGWNETILEERAKEWGHNFTHILVTSSGFHVGLTSSVQFRVVDDRTNGFHHGQIHAVFFENPAVSLHDAPDDNDEPLLPPVESGINVLVTHLSPNDAQERLAEAHHIDHLNDEYCNLVLMGDLNALSEHDALLYDCKGTLATIENLPDTTGNLARNKFLHEDQLDYRTMESLYREGRLQDAEFVHRTAMGVAKVPPLNATVPTSTSTDVVHVVEARLDYVLLSKSLADRVVSCRTLHGEDIESASDHRPVVCDVFLS